MARRSSHVLRAHPKLFVFPLIGGLSGIAFIATLLGSLFITGPLLQEPGAAFYAALVLSWMFSAGVSFSIQHPVLIAIGVGYAACGMFLMVAVPLYLLSPYPVGSQSIPKRGNPSPLSSGNRRTYAIVSWNAVSSKALDNAAPSTFVVEKTTAVASRNGSDRPTATTT